MDDRRFLGYSAGWAFLMTVCVTAVVTTVPGSRLPWRLFFGVSGRFVPEASDWAARIAHQLGTAFYVALFAILILLPVGVAAYRSHRGSDSVTATSLLIAGLVVFPGIPLAVLVAESIAAGLVVVVVAVAFAAIGIRSQRPGTSVEEVVAPSFVHVALAVVLTTGLIAGTLVGVSMAGTAVESTQVRAPEMAFNVHYTAVDEERGIVTFAHEGGDVVTASRLTLNGTGFANVSEVDQTNPGPWTGTVSGDGQVVAGDFATVGVEPDCTIRIVYTDAGVRHTLAVAHCSDLR